VYTLPNGTKVPNLCPPFPASPTAVKVNEWPNGASDHGVMTMRDFLPAHFHSDATTTQARLASHEKKKEKEEEDRRQLWALIDPDEDAIDTDEDAIDPDEDAIGTEEIVGGKRKAWTEPASPAKASPRRKPPCGPPPVHLFLTQLPRPRQNTTSHIVPGLDKQ